MNNPGLSIGDWSSSGTDAFGVAWDMDNLDGWDDSAPVRVAFPAKGGSDGGTDQRGYYGPRVLTWTGYATAHDVASLAAAKVRLRAAGHDLNVGFDIIGHMPDGDYLVHAKRSDVWKVNMIGATAFQYMAVATCPDSRIYSAALHSITATLVDNSAGVGGAFKFNATFPMGFSGPAAGAGLVSVFNAGSETSYPVIRVSGPGTNLRLADQASGSALTITSLGVGEFVDLDTLNHRVLLMGYQSRRDLLAAGSEWFGLPAGFDTLSFSASAFSSASAAITWRDAY
jgi:hypothetical protein